jgi:hypothetical protein
MPPRIIPAFDEIKNLHACLSLVSEAGAIEQFALERGKEALTHRVVIRITDTTHRRSDARMLAAEAKGYGRILGLPISIVIAVYAIYGLIGGILLGLLRPLTNRMIGAAIVGWLLAFGVYAGFSISMGYPPWRWNWFYSLLLAVAALIVGGSGGVAHWRRHVGQRRAGPHC